MNTSRKLNGGFSLVEVMVALVILAMLMTAVAVAFDASISNYHANRGIYQTMNTARQALLRITNDIRTASTVGIIGTDDPDNTQVSLITASGDDITYRYDSGDNTLYYVTNDDTSDADYVLCENITAMAFNRATFIDNNDSFIEKVRNVRISMTLTDESGDVSESLNAASVVRKNL